MLNQGVLPLRPAKAEPLFALVRGEGVDDFREPVRTRVVEAVERGLQQHRDRGEAEHDHRIDQHREHRELHFSGFDLLAEIFGRAPHHQSRDENRDHDDDEETIQPRADAARPDAAGQNVEQRHQAAERGQRIVHRDDCAGARPGRRGREQRVHRLPEAYLLAFQVAEQKDRPRARSRPSSRRSPTSRPFRRRRAAARPSSPESHGPAGNRRLPCRRPSRRRPGSATTSRSG